MQAALAASTRTAAFARTGEFPDEDEGVTGAGARRGSGRAATGSYDSSYISTGASMLNGICGLWPLHSGDGGCSGAQSLFLSPNAAPMQSLIFNGCPPCPRADSADEGLFDAKAGGRPQHHRHQRQRLDSLMALSSVASGELAGLEGLLRGGGGGAPLEAGLMAAGLWDPPPLSAAAPFTVGVASSSLPALEELLSDSALLLAPAPAGANDPLGHQPNGRTGAGAAAPAAALPLPGHQLRLGTAAHLSPAGSFLPLPLGLIPSLPAAAPAMSVSAGAAAGGLAPPALGSAAAAPVAPPPLLVGPSSSVSQVRNRGQ